MLKVRFLYKMRGLYDDILNKNTIIKNNNKNMFLTSTVNSKGSCKLHALEVNDVKMYQLFAAVS